MDNNEKEKVSFSEKRNLRKEQKKERKALEKANAQKVAPEDAKLYRNMTIAMVVIAAILVIGTVISLTVAGVNNKQKANRLAQFRASDAVTNVSVETVRESHYNEVVHLNATLKSLNGVVNVYSPVYGKLYSNEVRLGDRVQKDDILGYVDASDIGVDYELAPVYALSDGIVVAINSVRGDTNTAQSVLYTIAPEPQYVLQGSVSERDLGSLTVGDNATFTTVSHPNVKFNAVLHYIAPIINETTRTATLEFDVVKDDNYELLSPGMFVSVDADSASLDNVITVPTNAIGTYLDNTVVYVVESDSEGHNVARRVIVEVSRSNGSVSVISSGLKQGDRVVVAGAPKDGETVNVIEN